MLRHGITSLLIISVLFMSLGATQDANSNDCEDFFRHHGPFFGPFNDTDRPGNVIFTFDEALQNTTLNIKQDECTNGGYFNITGLDVYLLRDLLKDCDLPFIACKIECTTTVGGNLFKGKYDFNLNIDRKPYAKPEFKRSTYSRQIQESISVPYTIFSNLRDQINKSDCINGFQFSLEDNFDGTFLLDNAGNVELKKQVDYEGENVYNLSIYLKDSLQRNATTQLSVTITDVDDMDPKFDHDIYKLNVTEGTGINLTQWRSTSPPIFAEDQDKGDGRHDVLYKFKDATSVFKINETSGTIKVNQFLNRESVSEYTFVIQAVQVNTDVRSATATLNIFVDDINDNLPHFKTPPHDINITEHSNEGTYVTQVSAMDKDVGLHAETIYRIENNNNIFRIDEDGIIYVKNSKLLDRETNQTIVLMIAAIDKDKNETGDYVDITINLLDINDNSPKITTREFHTYTTAVGMVLGQIYSVDKDFGANGNVTLSLISPEDKNNFELDEHSGILKLKTVLLGDASVLIEACDNPGTTSNKRCSQSVVYIYSSGNFTAAQLNQTAFIAENSKIGTIVTNIEVEGTNYDIKPNDTFSITDGGLLQTNAFLDREKDDIYNVTVKVFSSNNRLLANISVEIVVIDTNDNIPIFKQDDYTFILSGPHQLVGTVQATDNDSKGNNSKIQYVLKDTLDSMYFTINGDNGSVYLSDKAMPMTKNFFQLTVVAMDFGDPILSSSTTVYISRIIVAGNGDSVRISTPLEIEELIKKQKHLEVDIAEILQMKVLVENTESSTDSSTPAKSYLYISAKYKNDTKVPGNELQRMVLRHMNEIEALFSSQSRCTNRDDTFGASEIALIALAAVMLIGTTVAIVIVRYRWDSMEKYRRLNESLTRRSSLYESQEIKLKIEDNTSDYTGSLNTNELENCNGSVHYHSENGTGNGNSETEMTAFSNPIYVDDETQLKGSVSAVEAINEAISSLDHAYENEEEMENNAAKPEFESTDQIFSVSEPAQDYEINENSYENNSEERNIQHLNEEPARDYEDVSHADLNVNAASVNQNYENVDLIELGTDSLVVNVEPIRPDTRQNKENGEHEYANSSHIDDNKNSEGDEPQPDYNLKQVRFSGEVLDTDENKIEPLKEENDKSKKQKSEDETDSEGESPAMDTKVPPSIIIDSDDNDETLFKLPVDHADESDRVDEEINSPTNFLKPEISENSSGTFHFSLDDDQLEVEVTAF